jgi:hypothetical protein
MSQRVQACKGTAPSVLRTALREENESQGIKSPQFSSKGYGSSGKVIFTKKLSRCKNKRQQQSGSGDSLHESQSFHGDFAKSYVVLF